MVNEGNGGKVLDGGVYHVYASTTTSDIRNGYLSESRQTDILGLNG